MERMNIKMSEMNYRFNENGETEAIEVQYSNHDGQSNEQFYVRAVLTEGDFNEMTRNQADQAAKVQIMNWLQPKSEENPSPAQ